METLPAKPRARSAPAIAWTRFPSIYEINTWIWLSELSRKHGKQRVDLSSVPADEWDDLARYGFDAVWLMGVWERSPVGIAIANRNKALLEDFSRSLPDFRAEDNVGSPYCVRRYVVDQNLGGPGGLAVARRELMKRGMNLVLDFVPNHVAPDHPWVGEHPEYFIQSRADSLTKDPSAYLELGGRVYACGKDPYFPAWPDVLQLNAFAPGLRKGAIETLSSLAEQCDGVRCDMAMLLLSPVFERTWGSQAGPRPAGEYWVDVIGAIKRQYPHFLFIAEAYWNLEWELQQKGFDFCYDKKLYDRLEHSDAESIRLHLCADMTYQEKLLRFIENHDEPRAAAAFEGAKQQAVAVASATLPGCRLFHEGQFEGRTVKPSVFLGRRPHESRDAGLQDFYRKLMELIDCPAFHDGHWSLCERAGWPDNPSFRNLVAWTWEHGQDRYLIVVNLSNARSQGQVKVAWRGAAAGPWLLCDRFSGATYERNGPEMAAPGLYVELSPWKYHVFECMPLSDSMTLGRAALPAQRRTALAKG